MKKLISAIIIFALFLTTLFSTAIFTKAEETEKTQTTFFDSIRNNYELVFSDDFDGDSLDMTKWRYAGSATHRNWELQTYDDSPEDGNTYIEDGCLVLEAKKEDRKCLREPCPYYAADDGIHNYTSGSVSMKDTEGFKYGLFEASIKLPSNVSGVWPAFWSLGRDETGKLIWPDYGEIDIMEHFGHNYVYNASAMHYKLDGGHKVKGGGNFETTDEEFITGFHTFGILWTPNYILFYLDDSILSIVDISDPSFSAFNEYKQALILNIALGGAAGGSMDDSIFTDKEKYPDGCKMYIDYVKVYQPKESFNALNDAIYLDAEDCEITGEHYADKYWGLSMPYLLHYNKMNVGTTIELTTEEISDGNYDIYLLTVNSTAKGAFDLKINGVTTNENKSFFSPKPIVAQQYVGTAKVEGSQPLNLSFTCTTAGSGAPISIDKVLLVKSYATPDVTINDDNNVVPTTNPTTTTQATTAATTVPTTAATTAATTTATTVPTTNISTTETTTSTQTEPTTSTTAETTTAIPFTYGDANDDNSINSKDSMAIRKYIAAWEIQINLNASDVNLDGDINAKDNLLLKKYIANWDVQLGVKQ